MRSRVGDDIDSGYFWKIFANRVGVLNSDPPRPRFQQSPDAGVFHVYCWSWHGHIYLFA